MKDQGNQVGCEIHRLEHMISKELEARVKDAGIDEVTLMHGWIMRFLYANRDQDIYQKDLEKYFHVGRSTVTSTIKLMEKRGLICRESVEWDARLKKVLLTEKGIKSHETIEALIDEINSGIMEGIDAKEGEIFLKVLLQVRENVEKKLFHKEKEAFYDPDVIK